VIECPASGQPFYGQDAQYVTNPMSFTVGLDGFTVTDNVTGLVWQREDDNSPRTWGDAISYCEGLDLGGHTDWRLPAVKELQSIVDYGRHTPSIDALAFPETDSDYWSSSTLAIGTDAAWYISFYYGHVFVNDKAATTYVRCVRGESIALSFTDNGDGTVTDNVTELIWQREDDNIGRSWESALAHCEGLDLGGHTDWRLPAVKELQSIVDYGRYSPSIDALVFPEAISDCWSSSTHAYSTRQAWDVDFSYGHVGKDDKSDANSVRCVR
jgi:hypothetical protein